MELKELIEKRWQASAAGYGESIRKELSDERGKWEAYIQKHVIIEEGMKILDIGCGPGFFTILMSGKGHETMGIDASSKMIEEAKKNAKQESANAVFKVMDCHHTEFMDNTFDLIVSRNVVWTLLEPEKAYREWYRILKPDGKMLIFDAAYNREFHDPKLMEEKKRRKKELGIDSEVSEYFCRDQKLGLELDQRSVLGAVDRPEWDEKVLKKIGFLVATDRNAWKEVGRKMPDRWVNLAPLFLLECRK